MAEPYGTWSFETIRPGSYPGSRMPGHIHCGVSATGFAARIFEIVFEGDPFVTTEMRRMPRSPFGRSARTAA